MDVKCTQCGAKVPIEEDTSFIRCPYCETALYVETDRTVKHYYMQSHVEPNDVTPQIQRKLSYQEIKDEISLGETRDFYFPFWRLDTKMGRSIMIPAAMPPIEDLASIKPPAGDLKLYSEEIGEKHEMQEPSLLLEDAVIEAQKAIGVKEIVKFTAASIVHLPFITVHYACHDNEYQAVIEAVSGEVYADDWPAASAFKKDLALGWIAALAFALFALEAALVPWLPVTLALYACTAAGIYFLARSALEKIG